MKFSFRFQFILAPVFIIILLTVLVAYTLFELANIKQGNKTTRYWEVLTDKIQTAIVAANQVNTLIANKDSLQALDDEDQLFVYLEQSQILSEVLFNPFLNEKMAAELSHKIKTSGTILQEVERVTPAAVRKLLDELQPALDYQYKIFAAQRRSATINNHRELVAVSSRLTTTLIAALILCILFAAGLSLWGLSVTRRRLKGLTERINSVCVKADSKSCKSPRHDELDNLEECLSSITRRLLGVNSVENALRGAESERQRIAMEMHDGILADLTAINRYVDNISSQCDDERVCRDKLKNLRQDVDATIGNLRDIIDDLHPQVLETLGLESALRSFMQRYARATGFPDYQFEFAEDIETRLNAETKLNLFRIVSEAINNAVNHAQCTLLEVCIRKVNDELVVSIEDNGIGMDDKKISRGYGCANIRERASFIGASVQWLASRFASGTCVRLELVLGAES